MKKAIMRALIVAVAGILGMGLAAAGQEVRKGRVLERAAGKTEGAQETRLMLELSDAPMDKVAGMLQEMSGTRIELSGVEGRAAMKMENGTFLRGLMEAAKSAGLTIERPERSNLPINSAGNGVTWKEGSAQGYQLKAGDDLWKLPMSDGGWGMVFVAGVNQYSSENFLGSRASTSETTIAMLLLAERNREILRHSGFALVDEAITDKGVSLILDKPIEPELNLYSRGLMPFYVRIKNAPEGAKLRSLKGKVFVAVEEKSEDWVIENAASAPKQSKRIMDMETLDFESRGNGGFGLSMKGEQKQGTPRPMLMSQDLLGDRMMMENNGVYVKLQGMGGGMSWSMQNGINVYSQFSQTYQPTGKVVIRLPAEVKAAVIPFEFKDLELP